MRAERRASMSLPAPVPILLEAGLSGRRLVGASTGICSAVNKAIRSFEAVLVDVQVAGGKRMRDGRCLGS